MTVSGRRVLITGTYCSLNKGDAAMRIALTDELKKIMPDCHITMMTPYPEYDSSAYKSDLTLRCSRRRPARALSMLIRALCWRMIRKLTSLDVYRMLDNELKLYKDSDIIIDLSGDGLTEEYGTRCLLAHLVPIILGELLDKPTFVCGQTIGPLKKTKLITKWALKRADKISARERITYNYLRSLGIKEKSLSLTADMAFLMEPASAARADQILQEEGVPSGRPLIGFSISRLPGHIHGTIEQDEPSRFELQIAEALDLCTAFGLQPVFISHATGPGKRRDDRLAAHRVADLAKSKDDIFVLEGDYKAEETKAVIGKMEIFTGVRMHSCIAAMSTGIPTICIAYGPKAYGIMDLAGQAEWLVDIRYVTADQLFGLIERIWLTREAHCRQLRSNIERVRSLSSNNTDIIIEMIGEKMLTDAAPLSTKAVVKR